MKSLILAVIAVIMAALSVIYDSPTHAEYGVIIGLASIIISELEK